MFLSTIDFGLTPAHPYAPEEERLFGCYRKHCYCCTNRSGCGIFFPLGFCWKSRSCWKLPKRSWERSCLFICGGEALERHIPALHLQNTATKRYRWRGTEPLFLLCVCFLLQEAMRSAVPAPKIPTSFAHPAKFGDGLHLLTTSDKSVKLIRVQVSKKLSLSPAHMVNLQSFNWLCKRLAMLQSPQVPQAAWDFCVVHKCVLGHLCMGTFPNESFIKWKINTEHGHYRLISFGYPIFSKLLGQDLWE